MPILTLKNINYSVGQFPLLAELNIDIQAKERIALIGRNGEGKSTLLKILAGIIQPDGGEILKPSYLTISRLAQELPAAEDITVFTAVAQGLAKLSDLLIRYHQLSSQTEDHDDSWMNNLHAVQQQIDQLDAWQVQERIVRIIQALQLPENTLMSALSGGWRRRVGLAQALVQEPDILLLDEPTNHLDLHAIHWLEKLLLNYPKTLIFITHDRALLRKIATKILSLDRGKLTVYPPDYDQYLALREKNLADEQRQQALFDKKLSAEEQWLRQGVKARRTRNEGRVRALKALREERSQRRVVKDKPIFVTNDPLTGGKTVIQAENLCFGYSADKQIIKDFSFTIQRGDKIAIVGENGKGKTTLVKLLIGALSPSTGKIKLSPTNQIAFFDQNREHLDQESTVMANVAEGDDVIDIQGKNKHVIGYLGDFLFSPDKCRALVKTLSGGEQNRLMLAKLFAKKANVLVLDEPTNDLDIESLDVLEDLLLHYPGTVIIISHDREFIDNIATHCLAFREDNTIDCSVGGYSDWLNRTNKTVENKSENKAAAKKANIKPPRATAKLSYKEQTELAALPQLIEKLEQAIAEQEQRFADLGYKTPAEIVQAQKILAEQQQALQAAYTRWEELDAKSR